MRVFLDHAATTPLSRNARKQTERWLDSGNASSLYAEGRAARAAVDVAREILADRLGVDFGEVIFTGSGTEAASAAIVGSALAAQGGVRKEVILSAAEHHCALHTAPFLTSLGYQPLFAPVDRYGRIQTKWLEDALSRKRTLLVAAMHVNNELGSVNPVQEIGGLCQRFGALYFCDAVQSFGKLNFRARDLGADLVSMSGHKVYGPKGVGALYVKAGTPLKPFIVGGGQERELRAGTENVAAIAGFGAAVAEIEHRDFSNLKKGLRVRLEAMGGVFTLSDSVEQLDSHIHFRFPGLTAESLLICLDREGISLGSGAACSSGSLEPSHVLSACGYSDEEAKEGLRLTFGNGTDEVQIERAFQAIERSIGITGYRVPTGT